MIIVSDRNATAFDRSGATRAPALDISKAFNRVWDVGLFHKIKSYGISNQIFGLILSFLSNRLSGCGWKVYKNVQLILEFLKAPFLLLNFSHYTLMTLMMLSVILLSMLMILLSTRTVIRYLICGNN